MPTLTHGDGQDVLDAFKRAWEQRDPELGTGLFSDDAEFRTDPFTEPLQGSLAIRAYWNAFAAASVNAEFDAERIWVVDGTVLSSWHAATTERASGERARFRGFMTLELDEGRKVRRGRMWTVQHVVGVDSTVKPEPVQEVARGR